MDCSPPGYHVHGILQARILEWAGCSLLQGIFPTQGSNPGLLRCRQILDHLSHQGNDLKRRTSADRSRTGRPHHVTASQPCSRGFSRCLSLQHRWGGSGGCDHSWLWPVYLKAICPRRTGSERASPPAYRLTPSKCSSCKLCCSARRPRDLLKTRRSHLMVRSPEPSCHWLAGWRGRWQSRKSPGEVRSLPAGSRGRTSLLARWLGLCAFTAEGAGSLVGRLRSCKPHAVA